LISGNVLLNENTGCGKNQTFVKKQRYYFDFYLCRLNKSNKLMQQLKKIKVLIFYRDGLY
jgi:hypothetical protein